MGEIVSSREVQAPEIPSHFNATPVKMLQSTDFDNLTDEQKRKLEEQRRAEKDQSTAMIDAQQHAQEEKKVAVKRQEKQVKLQDEVKKVQKAAKKEALKELVENFEQRRAQEIEEKAEQDAKIQESLITKEEKKAKFDVAKQVAKVAVQKAAKKTTKTTKLNPYKSARNIKIDKDIKNNKVPISIKISYDRAKEMVSEANMIREVNALTKNISDHEYKDLGKWTNKEIQADIERKEMERKERFNEAKDSISRLFG